MSPRTPIKIGDILAKESPHLRAQQTPVQPKPKWIDMNSENMKAILYDPTERNLIVQFRNNETIGYVYGAVSQTLFEGLQKAESPTAYLRRYIIPTHPVARMKL